MRKTADQNLDATEDIDVILLTENEVLDMLLADKMKQSLMATPLWKYFALYSRVLPAKKDLFI